MTLFALMYHEPQHLSCVGLYRSEQVALYAATKDWFQGHGGKFDVSCDALGLTLTDVDDPEKMYRIEKVEVSDD